MSYTPPFRTRRTTQPQVEPHLGDTEPGPPEKTLTWTTASDRPLADDPTPAPRPVHDDDDALPVLTQLVEPPAVPSAPAVRSFVPASEPIEEPIDEELVARITDDVLDALQPVLYELVGDAIRRALKENAR